MPSCTKGKERRSRLVLRTGDCIIKNHALPYQTMPNYAMASLALFFGYFRISINCVLYKRSHIFQKIKHVFRVGVELAQRLARDDDAL